jgi:hypothetical protein
MVYHTFVSGEVLTAANVMNNLMNQSVIVCTSGTRPSSPVAGMTIFETDTIQYAGYTGAAWVYLASITPWTSYTPTLTNISLGNGGMSANYARQGKSCFVRFSFTFGSTSTLGGGVPSFTLPFTSVTGPIQSLAGTALDSSAAQGYVLNGRILSASTTCELIGATAYASSTTPFTWATSDTIGLDGVFEMA